jgi:hypothetical protein
VALSADQQAMLQLLLERGQSYADLASLLGVDEAEVRARARATLTELAGTDPDRHVGMTDYLLGQADPIGRADAVRHLKDDPADLELAMEVAQKIRLIAPGAELPRLPGEERRPRPRRARGAASSRLPVPDRLRRRQPVDETAESGAGAEAEPQAGPPSTLSRRQTQLLVGFGSAAVLIVVVVLVVVGAFGGDDGGSEASTTASNNNASRELARVRLRPQSGAGASGTVVFGLASNASEPYVDVTLDGLKPPTQKQVYVLWLLFTPDQGYPVVLVRPCGPSVPEPCLSENGSYRDRASFAPEVLPLIARVRFVDVSIAPVAEVTKAVNTAAQNQDVTFTPPGTTILRGTIPGARGGANAG